MTTRKTVLFLIALVLLIVVIALQFAGPKQADSTEMTQALGARYDLPPFTVIKASDLEPLSIPLQGAGHVYTEPAALEGLLTTTEIRGGNAIKAADVIRVPENRMPDESTLIYSFYVPTARVIGGQLRPGHYIDMLATRTDTRDEGGQSLWLARGVWVVGVQQSSGDDVRRATPAVYGKPQETPRAGGLFGGDTGLGSNEGPANLVMVATHREIAQMIGDYLGAQRYDAWVYIRPSGSSANVARIDGVVFEDAAPLGMQTRDELGIDRVSVTLFDENGVTKATAQTNSGGKFHFDNLAPATYRVTVTTPDGYTPATPQELSFFLADGQNQHLWFGEQQEQKEEIKVVAQATAAPQPTATAAPKPASSGAGAAYALHMSDRENGPEIAGFPSGVAEVWVVLSFRDAPADTPYTVKVQSMGSGGQERVVSVGSWKGGSGPTSIRVAPWEGEVFADGPYVTSLETGAEKTQRAFKPWTVGGDNKTSLVRTQVGTGPEEVTPIPAGSER